MRERVAATTALAATVLLVLLAPVSTSASPAVGLPSDATPTSKTADPLGGHRLELSLGHSQLFIEQSIRVPQGANKKAIVPVGSALFLAEYLLTPSLSAAFFFNLPLKAQQTIVDGQLYEEYAAPAAAIGMRWSPLRFKLFTHSRMGLQFGALVGRTFGSDVGDTFFPLVMSRLHFTSRVGFAMYIGTAFAFRKDTIALIYGIGHRF